MSFLKNSVLGLIILGMIGSILGVFLLSLLKKLNNNFKKHRLYKSFEAGWYAAYATRSNYHQIIYIGRLIVEFILTCFYILIVLNFTLFLFIKLDVRFYWIIVFVSSILLSYCVLKLYQNLVHFRYLYKKMFESEKEKDNKNVKSNSKKHISQQNS